MKFGYRWSGIGLVAAVLVCVFGLGSAGKEQEPEQLTHVDHIVLRLAETYPRAHPSAQAAQRFADLVEQRTNGRIQIQVYYGGELGNESEVLEQVQFGGIALARVNLLELSDTVSVLQPYIEPFAYPSPEGILNLFKEKEDTISLQLQLEKMIPLVWYYPDLRCFYNDRHPIQTLDDFHGMKLKTELSRAMSVTLEKLGAEPVHILTGDTFKSLNGGYMDGGEESLCGFVLSDIYSVVPYATVSNYLYSPDVIVGSLVPFSKIEREDQKLLISCAQETYAYQKQLLLSMQKESLQKIQQKSPDAESQERLERSLRTLYSEEGGETG